MLQRPGSLKTNVEADMVDFAGLGFQSHTLNPQNHALAWESATPTPELSTRNCSENKAFSIRFLAELVDFCKPRRNTGTRARDSRRIVGNSMET